MKKFMFLILLAMFTMNGCQKSATPTVDNPSSNHEWFVVGTRRLSKDMQQSLAGQVLELIGERSHPQDVIHLIEAPSHTLVATLETPNGGKNSRLHHADVKKALPKIRELLAVDQAESSDQLQLPMLVNTLGSLRRTTFPCRIILIGNPLYDDKLQSGWSMLSGLIPSDGVLLDQQTPFYIHEQLPENTTLTLLTPKSEWGVDAAHQQAVTRFFRLYFQKQRGTLIRITADPVQAFNFDIPQFNDLVAERSETSSMKVVNVKSNRAADTPTNSERTVPVKTAEPHSEPAPTPQPTTSLVKPPVNEVKEILNTTILEQGKMAFAINWESDDPRCDLDLWISCKGHSQELYHRQMNTPFGELLRDVTRTGTINSNAAEYSNWECAKINNGRLEDLTIWVNAYSTTKPVKVRFIWVHQGKQHEKLITMNITQGDSGNFSLTRNLSSAWVKVGL